jgi:hypothetical protein
MITYSNNGSRKALLKNRSIDNIDIIIIYENNCFLNFNNNEFPLILAITSTRIYNNNKMSLFSNIQKPVLQTIQQKNSNEPIATQDVKAACSVYSSTNWIWSAKVVLDQVR